MKRDIMWFILLPIAIVMGFAMPQPVGMVQSIAAAGLLGLKIYLKIKK